MRASAQTRHGVRLRPGTAGDATLLFEWLNRPDSLVASLDTSAPVTWADHKGWVDTRLADSHTRIWIVERDATPVGSIRLQDKGVGPEIAIYIDAAARSTGVAGTALGLALDEAHSVWPGREAIARVRPDNDASRQLFERTGFTLRDRADDHLIYTHSL
ncbi:MAG: GNAT family N-acetyltransferase [Alphaproteobacteria bacterium]